MKIAFRIFAALLFVALIVGAGAFAYKAGMAQGISQAPEVAAAIEKAAENGQGAPVAPFAYGHGYPYSYGYGYGRPHGFNPFGAICFSIFFLFLFFGFMKMMFFRRMRHAWGHHGHHGPWGKNWEGGPASMFNVWHKRAHEGKPDEDGKGEEEKKSE